MTRFDTQKTYNYGETLGPAMKITDPAEARQYFDELVEYHMRRWNKTRAESEATERANLGYFAGYYDSETRERVERLFNCAHPVFGKIAYNGTPTPEQAFALDRKMGEQAKR